MNLGPNALQIENMKEEFVAPDSTRFADDKPKSLVMQEAVWLWHEQRTTQQTCSLLRHRYKQTAFIQNVVARDRSNEVLLLLAAVAIAAGLEVVAGREQNIVTFLSEVFALKGIPVLDFTQVRQRGLVPARAGTR